MSLFDAHIVAANAAIQAVMGSTATWAPSVGGATKSGTVIFTRPTDPATLDFADYLAAAPSIEYFSGTFDGLWAAVSAGLSEQVTVGGTTYPVLSVAMIEDGNTYRAILGEASLKQAREVPGSALAVKLVQDVVGSFNPATQRQGAVARITIVDFGKACTVRNLSVEKQASPTGTVEVGDIEVLIPAALATEAQLRTDEALILYGTTEYTIDRIDPHSAVKGTVVEWRVVGSQRAGADG